MAKRRPNNDGSIGRYKDRWRGAYTDPVIHKQRYVYGKTQAECKAKLDEKLAEIRKGIYVQPDKITVEGWLTFWFDKFYRRTVKASTAATTWGNIKGKLIPALGKYQLQKLSTVHVQAFVAAEMDAGRNISTIRRYLKVLNQALTQARELQRMNTDPVKGVKLPTMDKPEIQFLSHDEQAAFLAACPSTTNGRALRLLLYTGMRVSELCGLKWQDVQEDGLHVERINMTIKDLQEDGYVNVTTPPKTKAGKRIIPLTQQAQLLHFCQQNRTSCGSAQLQPLFSRDSGQNRPPWARCSYPASHIRHQLGAEKSRHHLSFTYLGPHRSSLYLQDILPCRSAQHESGNGDDGILLQQCKMNICNFCELMQN